MCIRIRQKRQFRKLPDHISIMGIGTQTEFEIGYIVYQVAVATLQAFVVGIECSPGGKGMAWTDLCVHILCTLRNILPSESQVRPAVLVKVR